MVLVDGVEQPFFLVSESLLVVFLFFHVRLFESESVFFPLDLLLNLLDSNHLVPEQVGTELAAFLQQAGLRGQRVDG